LKQLFWLLILFIFCRFLFFIVNFNYFYPLETKYVLSSFAYGCHFDTSAIIIYNSLYILLSLIPWNFYYHNFYRIFLNTIFLSFNILALLTNLSDVAYFGFSNKRTTFEGLYYLKTMNRELLSLIPTYIIHYWYLSIALGLMIIVLVKIRIKKVDLPINKLNATPGIFNYALFFFLLIFLSLTARGINKYPIKTSITNRSFPIEYNVLATNTPFSIIEYFSNNKESNYNFFNNAKLNQIFTTKKEYQSSGPFKKLNIIIIILESFSKEYVGILNNNKGCTPFLDSLIIQSFVCRNAYANGRTTLEALPAILGSLPSLGNRALILTSFIQNDFNSLPEILSSEGYQTSFFYGARNGNLGINNFSRKAGFKYYFGKNEYGNKKATESPWGVSDGDFLQFFLKKIDIFRQPFFSCILTLSSHSPYSIPKKYNQQFSSQTNSQLRSILYTDLCLKQFFDKASKSKWYKNTLFVITGDHASIPYSFKYRSKAGLYAIPIVYYMPADPYLKGHTDIVTQQCDIKPSILDYIGYNKEFSSFGNSIFRPHDDHFAVMKLQNYFQLIDNNFLVNLDDNEKLTVFESMNGTYHLDNYSLTLASKAQPEINKLKGIIQTFSKIKGQNIVNQ